MPLSRSLIKCIKIFIDLSDKPEKEMTYLETGLDEGNSAWDALTNFNFKKIISIEIDKTKIDKAKQKLQYENDYSKIILIEGNSPIQLRKIFDHSTDIIFLDAHGLYNDIDPTKIYPLEKELKFLINKMDEHQLII
ncbi:hypothetical protein OAR15_00970, partial [Candidatus Pelagibacter sp.]|nr:hypothetical protein [Candidatus Pelagibacter sp.]